MVAEVREHLFLKSFLPPRMASSSPTIGRTVSSSTMGKASSGVASSYSTSPRSCRRIPCTAAHTGPAHSVPSLTTTHAYHRATPSCRTTQTTNPLPPTPPSSSTTTTTTTPAHPLQQLPRCRHQRHPRHHSQHRPPLSQEHPKTPRHRRAGSRKHPRRFMASLCRRGALLAGCS